MPLPNMTEGLADLGTQVKLRIVGKGTVDFETVELENKPVTFYGILVPATPKKLVIKPEGQRSWQPWKLYTNKALELDWLIQNQAGNKYRVMAKWDWGEGGFLEYDLEENPLT